MKNIHKVIRIDTQVLQYRAPRADVSKIKNWTPRQELSLWQRLNASNYSGLFSKSSPERLSLWQHTPGWDRV